eukprot:1129079-Pleurochrysis_carterae.AAC.3
MRSLASQSATLSPAGIGGMVLLLGYSSRQAPPLHSHKQAELTRQARMPLAAAKSTQASVGLQCMTTTHSDLSITIPAAMPINVHAITKNIPYAVCFIHHPTTARVLGFSLLGRASNLIKGSQVLCQSA